MSVPLALALFTTYFYVWNEKRQNGNNVIILPIDCLILDEPADNPESESFGIPHSTDSPQKVSSIFLEVCSKDPCNIKISDTDGSDAGNKEPINPNDLTNEELHSIIDESINLYTQYQSLQERGLLSVFNPRFLNIMHQQALFVCDTMNCKTDTFDVNMTKIDSFISGLGFQILPVPKDGDCLFTSIIFQLEQMAPLSESRELSSFMEGFKSIDTLLEKVLFLRSKLVEEWLSNKQEYEKFLVDTELEDMAPEYRNPGVFTGQMGNMMLLGLANVLRMSFVVFTSMEHSRVIPVSSRTRPITAAPTYLAFNHAGPGCYDAVILCDSTVAAVHPNLYPEPAHKEPLNTGGCRCGKGGVQKRSGDGEMKSFCVQIPGERRVSCPCFLAQQGCNNCKCFNCGNRYGKQDNSKKEDSNAKRKRKREEHFVQRNSVSSLHLITERNVDITKTSWSELETFLFETLISTVKRKACSVQ